MEMRKFLLRDLEQAKDRNEKRIACQTSTDTHPVPATEANKERVEIIAILYTVQAPPSLQTVRERKASLLCDEDRLISQVEVCDS